MSEEQSVKRKRNRITPTHRWTEKQTSELLQKVLLTIKQHEAEYEKPTSQVFYKRIAKTTPVLRSIPWGIMKSKMRHIQTSYKAAVKWYDKGGPNQLDNYENEADYINKLCPHYHILKQIYDKVYHTNRAKEAQQAIDEGIDKMSIKKSSGPFLVLDTAAIAPDANAENSEMETELNEDLDDDGDIDEGNINNIESESYASNDEVGDVDTPEAQKLKFAEIKWEKQLESLESEKEKLRMVRNSAEKQKKRNRCINAPYHRWTDTQTENFLTAVFNTVQNNYELLEKPTSQRFYDKIIANTPSLRPLNWQVMKSKMRHLRLSYFKAVSWRKQMGTTLIATGKEREVVEYIQKICPFWRILVQIFGEIDDKNYNQNFDETTHTSYDDDISSELNEMPPFSSIEICKEEAIDEEELEGDTNGAVSTSGVATNNMYNEALWDGEYTDQSRKHNAEKAVDLSDAKWDKLMQLKILHLEVEKEKIQLERERTRNELEVKKLELQHQLEMRKLELQYDEKITIANQKLEIHKLEMQLKFNRHLK